MDTKLALAWVLASLFPAVSHAEDPVTLYGRVYATFENVEAQGTPNVPRSNRVTDQASFVGVRGTETLGRDVKAFFQLETPFQPDQNNTVFASRNSGVGLTTRAGSLLVGRWDTPFKWTNGDVDPFDDLTLGALSSVLQGSGIAGVTGQFDRRDQNVVQYWSPKLAGFEMRLSYSANEARTASTNPKSEGGSITWANGPFYAGYAYHELRDQPFGIYTNAALAIGSVIVEKQAANSIFGTVKLGAFKIGLDYQEFRRSSPVLPAIVTPGTVVGFDKQKAFMGNVTWTLGSHRLVYQYMKAKDGGQQDANAALTPESPECDLNAIGWQYDFSRRTFLLVQYVRIRNNATATCTFGQNPLTIAAGQDPRGTSIGLRHIF
ncbi:MAG TPA: porin [Usitatibacter sp.]|nr:porin [Usitatibacter sp.]